MRGYPFLALCLVSCSKPDPAPTPAPKVDYAAEEARATERARAATAELAAKQAETDRKAAELASACERIAADTSACTALKPEKREGARVCQKLPDEEVKACIAYRKGLARGF